MGKFKPDDMYNLWLLSWKSQGQVYVQESPIAHQTTTPIIVNSHHCTVTITHHCNKDFFGCFSIAQTTRSMIVVILPTWEIDPWMKLS